MTDLFAAIASAAGYCGFFPPFGIFCLFGPDRIDDGRGREARRP